MRIAYALTLAFAAAAGAWFALGIRQAHDITAATNIIAQPNTVTPFQSGRAASLLSSAGTLNPDTDVDVLRARLAGRNEQFERAQHILEKVVHEEPMNLEAWGWLAGMSLANPPIAHLAEAHIAKLMPNVPAGR